MIPTLRFSFVLSIILLAANARALPDLFTDPDDGMFDISKFLLDYPLGVLPVPVIVTEPAIGEGAGVAALFFHDNDQQQSSSASQEKVPPSVSALVGIYTNKDSWIVGGGHIGHYKNDDLRYVGALGEASLNLDFYGVGKDSDAGLSFNIKAKLISQEVLFRLGSSNWFLGGDYTFATLVNKFDLEIPGLPPLELESNNASASAVVLYDSLDNTYSPNRGLKIKWEYAFFNEAVGGDFDYQQLNARNQVHVPLTKHFILGLRLDGQFADGEVPFYAAPYIDMKGIPAMRYQDLNVLNGEARLTWLATQRWHFNVFSGGGWAAENFDEIFDSSPKNAYGIGMRYLAAKAIGLSTGFDIAKGPEDTVFYLGFGRNF